MTLRYQEYIDKGLFKKCCREQDLAVCNRVRQFLRMREIYLIHTNQI